MGGVKEMRMLKLAEGMELPLDFVTESSAILAKKGAGKTNALMVLLEEVAAAGVPVVSIDPKGDHWGIRAGSEEYPNAGLPVPVFGGLHADVPLEPTAAAGAYVAELLRDRGLSAVIDVSEFTIGERAKFLTAFADKFYRFDSREPVLLALEEAHEYIPQMVRGEEARMVGAFEKLVKLGRSKGIGVVMVTQRSASLNKNVLTQADNLFVMRTTAPQDRATVKAWLDEHADRGVLEGLGALQTGECVLVQPARGEPIQFRFRMRHTFDAGETPKVGERRREPATIADVNLEEIAAAMADTIEKAKADDPKLLRSRIAQLERDLADATEMLSRPAVAAEPVIVEVSILTEEDRLFLSNQATLLHDGVLGLMRTAIADVNMAAEKIVEVAKSADVRPPPVTARPAAAAVRPPKPSTRETPPQASPRTSTQGEGRLGKAERTILAVLATYGVRTHVQLALLTGYSHKSGGFRNSLSSLRTAGYIEGGRDAISITAEGVDALGEFEPLPTGEALVQHWMGQAGGQAHRAILEVLIDAYPRSLSADQIADFTGYSATSGGFRNALSRLRTLELAHGGRDAVTAAVELGVARHGAEVAV
jgi:hypothetical protein